MYCTNNNFNVMALTDANGAVVERVKYDPYGQPTCTRTSDSDVTTASHFATPWLFQGQRYCSETGIYYFKNRDQRPDLGRFLQRDPIGYADGMGLYEVEGSLGLSRLDPLGLKEEESPSSNAVEEVRDAAIEIAKEKVSDKIQSPVADPPSNKIKYVARPLSSKAPEPVRPVNPKDPLFNKPPMGAVVSLAGMVVESGIDALNGFSNSHDCMSWYKRTGKCLGKARRGDCCCCSEIDDFTAGDASKCTDDLAKVPGAAGGWYSGFQGLAAKVARKCHEQCAP